MRWNRSNRLSLGLGLAATAALLLHSQPGYAQAPLFTALPYLPYADVTFPFALSDDGSTVVGFSRGFHDVGFAWTREGGIVSVGDLPGGNYESEAFAVSADGSVIVGRSQSALGLEAFRWTSEGGMVGLGDLPDEGFGSTAFGVSADGATVLLYGGPASTEMFIWTSEGGLMGGLGTLPGKTYAFGWDISADGGTVVGDSDREAFLWTSEGGMVSLGFLPGAISNSIARAVSGDGSIAVGYASRDATCCNGAPFRWTSETGMVELSGDPNYNGGGAYAISSDGSTIVGQVSDRLTEEVPTSRAWIWDATHGGRALRDVLTDHGLNLTGWTLLGVTDVSGDGRAFVGWGDNPEGNRQRWVAVLGDPAFMPALHPGAIALLLCLLAATGAFSLRTEDNT